jgi:hypothetical protein
MFLKVLFLAVALVLQTIPLQAATLFYVDPDYTQEPRDGSAAHPWQSLADAGALTAPWKIINDRLAADAVTVFFSARNAPSDTDQTSKVGIELKRIDGSSNRLTLDGMSKWNLNDLTPTWSNYTGASRFRIVTSYPVNSGNYRSPWQERHHITVRGFKLVATNGQIAALLGVKDLVFELNDCSHSGVPRLGPGVIIGHPSDGSPNYPEHVIVRNNVIHETFGEAIYVSGSTGGPPGAGDVRTGNDILIQGNTIVNAGWFGGQGDGIDVKDGNTNLRIVGNTIHLASNWPSRAWRVQGIIVEGADLIEGNFIYDYKTNGIVTVGAWNNSHGRKGLAIRNNIIVNTLNGLKLNGGRPGFGWTDTAVYNNTIYKSIEVGILVPLDRSHHDNISIVNNIVWGSGTLNLDVPWERLGVHNYNDFYRGNAGISIKVGNDYYDASNLAKFESRSISSDPRVVNALSPYRAEGFKLNAWSPAIGRALPLNFFDQDYFGISRAAAWDLGATAFTHNDRTGS